MKLSLRSMIAGMLLLASASVIAQAPTDGQIAGILIAANKVDIDAGTLAKSRAASKEVKDFAQHMVTDHTGSNKQAGKLLMKLKIKPQESETSKKLRSDGAATLEKLKGLKGAEFDKAYIDNEVSYHETVLGAMDKTLIPAAQNAELKGLLEKTRPVIDDHLQMAKKIQASMK